MRCFALAVVTYGLVVACHHDDPSPHAGSAAGSASHDPWQVAPGAAVAVGSAEYMSWPPSLGERHTRAERLCPTVTPYFFELSKDGKTSHILGTRHVGVPFAKLPKVVHDDLHAAKLAVFEVAPDDKGGFDE